MKEIVFVLCELMVQGQPRLKSGKVVAENKKICYNQVCFDAFTVKFNDGETLNVIEANCQYLQKKDLK